jgi:pilus assembly protein CpaE
MAGRRTELTALLVAANRGLADQFNVTVAASRAFNLVGDLKSYPTTATLDMRLRQLRPDVVLIDFATNVDTACELVRHLTTLKPPVVVVALHTHNDSEAIVRSIRAGATEFLYAPFDVSIQEAAVTRIERLIQPEAGTAHEQGKVICFASTKPGSGASTLAVQTALALRRRGKKRILLTDFDLLGGTLGFYLNVAPAGTMIDVLKSTDRIDRLNWSGLVSTVNDIDVLAAPDMPFSEAVDPGRLHDLLEYARSLYDWVIIDMPTIFQRISLLTVSQSDKALLVTTSELASLHLARKAVKLLIHLGFDVKRFQVLINRIDKRDGVNPSDLNKLFDCDVDTSLPNDYFSLHRVVTMGEELDPTSDLGKAVDGLATKLFGSVGEEQKKTGRLATTRPALSHI